MGIENEVKKDYIRHGEAVALGILCEIYYSNKKNKLFNFAEKLFASYGLPVYLNIKKVNINKVKLAENIYKIFSR